MLPANYEDEYIDIRSQGTGNRSTEAALAFLHGLYPADTNSLHKMQDNQTAAAVPQMKISEDIM